MINYLLPIGLIVVSTTFYNICQKSTPSGANPFLAFTVTYLSATLVTVILLLIKGTDKGIMTSLKDLNWTSVALGISIVGIEFGYLMAYRAGWSMNIGSLVATTILSIVLIFVGMLIYKETLTYNQIIGIGLCIVGLIFVSK
ncbi:MAG: EamA family transporter [Eubacteriales bacterium]